MNPKGGKTRIACGQKGESGERRRGSAQEKLRAWRIYSKKHATSNATIFQDKEGQTSTGISGKKRARNQTPEEIKNRKAVRQGGT